MYDVEIAIEMLQAKIDIVYLAPITLIILTERGCEAQEHITCSFRAYH